MNPSKNKYNDLLKEIRQLVEQARHNVVRNINTELLLTYWNVGRFIVEYEQVGNARAEYGKQLLIDLSKSLARELGKGFSRSQLQMMRLFYSRFHWGSEPDSPDSVRQIWQPKKPDSVKQINSCPDSVRTTVEKSKKAIGLTVSNQLSWSHYYELLG